MAWPDDYSGRNGTNYSSISAQLISPTGGLIGGMIAITANSQQNSSSLEPVAYGGGQVICDVGRSPQRNQLGRLWTIGFERRRPWVGGNILISAPVNAQE